MKSLLTLAGNGLEYLKKKEKLSRAPMQISIEPTNLCNFKCSFCPQSNPDHQKGNKGRMEPARCENLLRRIIRDFHPDPGQRKISFTHDGDPFVNGQFEEILKIAQRLGFIIKFASNGYLATPDKIDSLLEAGVRFNICIDFTAEKEIFEKFRGFAGSYEVVKKNLRHILAQARNTGMISVDVCDISACYTQDVQRQEKLFGQLKAMFQEQDSARAVYKRRVFHNMTGSVQIPDKNSNVKTSPDQKKYHLCPYPWFNLNITWNGEVVPCCRDLDSKTILDNVFETDSLWEVWNSPAYLALRKTLAAGKPAQIAACKGCDLPYDSSRWAPSYVLHAIKSRLLRSGRQ